jgi:3-deoxy-manno-octulosonate cytidylyltransferase (CMP-KDO synthetase)
MTTIAVIPARLAATRFPRKPLADIQGIPMVVHCYLRTKAAAGIDHVYIATCDDEIAAVAESYGAPVAMTSVSHINAIDRTAEALDRIEDGLDRSVGKVVLVQGDEPLLSDSVLTLIVNTMEQEPQTGIVNVMVPFTRHEDFLDHNNPKVVVDATMRAMYMSREPIPSAWKGWQQNQSYMQTGLFGFRPEALRWFATAPRAPLELIEAIDMIRVLQAGRGIRMIRVEEASIGVDTPEDLEAVRERMITDPLFTTYRHLAPS